MTWFLRVGSLVLQDHFAEPGCCLSGSLLLAWFGCVALGPFGLAAPLY